MKAVVFVDVQKDFIDGALKSEKAMEVTTKIVEFAKECVEKGYKLYATRDTHEKTIRPDNSKFRDPRKDAVSGYFSTLEGQKLPIEHCIEGTDGWMIDEQLWDVVGGKCTVVNKPTFGSFDLVEVIDEDATNAAHHGSNLEEIVLCGFCTGICVAANAILLRAKFPNVKITVIKDLCSCVTKESHDAALKVLDAQQIDIV